MDISRLLRMDIYRVIVDGPAGFAVEVTHRDGVSHTTGGFHSRLDANAWVVYRMAVARVEVDERAKLISQSFASEPRRAPRPRSVRQPI
jgi:hypothetical protein